MVHAMVRCLVTAMAHRDLVPCNCEEMIAAIHSYTYYKNVASYGHDIASLFFI